jgi:hypothetical protein
MNLTLFMHPFRDVGMDGKFITSMSIERLALLLSSSLHT